MKATSARLALVGQITQHFPPAKKKLKKPSVLSHPIPSHPSSEGAAATDDKPFLPPSTSSFSSAGFFPFLFLHSPAKAIRASSEKREEGRAITFRQGKRRVDRPTYSPNPGPPPGKRKGGLRQGPDEGRQ